MWRRRHCSKSFSMSKLRIMQSWVRHSSVSARGVTSVALKVQLQLRVALRLDDLAAHVSELQKGIFQPLCEEDTRVDWAMATSSSYLYCRRAERARIQRISSPLTTSYLSSQNLCSHHFPSTRRACTNLPAAFACSASSSTYRSSISTRIAYSLNRA